jgi:hypothetical protein
MMAFNLARIAACSGLLMILAPGSVVAQPMEKEGTTP